MYDYTEKIHPPTGSVMGIKEKGTWPQVGKNINGLESYFQILSKGGGKASKVNGGMGNRYFVKAVGKCKGKGKQAGPQRYIYMDHIPTERSAQQAIFGEEVGIVPGLTNNVAQAMDPDNIINAVSGGVPECVKVSLSQVNSKGKYIGHTSKWVSKSDAGDIDACWFNEKHNPHAAKEKRQCIDSFANISDSHNIAHNAAEVPSDLGGMFDIPNPSVQHMDSLDTLETIYIAMLSGVGLYALHMLSSRT
jgi:hypothetical protein